MSDFRGDLMEVGADETAVPSSKLFRRPEGYEFPSGVSSEGSLARRFLGERREKPLAYEFSDDKALLQQYYLLRENMFISVWGLKNFYGGEDRYDSLSDILLVRRGNLCVGGMRSTLSTPQNRVALPMEDEEFNLTKLLPELDLANRSYTEFSRYAVLPDFQGPEVSYEISRRLAVKAASRGADYVFAVCPLGQARNYRRISAMLGLECVIRRDIEVPDREQYEGIRMYLDVFDIRPLTRAMANRQPHTAIEALS